ncbi:MAG: hypothetical protein ABJC19_03520 [Gemmatimonadota bacterium]
MVDQHGKLSVLGIWRQVVVSQIPAIHPRAHLVLHLRGRRTELGTHELAVRLIDPGGTVLLEQSGTLEVNEPPAGVVEVETSAVFVFDLPLPQSGDYLFLVALDHVEAARVPFHVGLTIISSGMH